MNLQESIGQIIQKAEELKLPYLVIGGHAIALYGIPRLTRDFDILIPDSHTEGWVKFLQQSFNYQLYHTTHAFLQLKIIKSKSVASNYPPIDIMLVGLDTWKKLFADAQRTSFSPEMIVQLPHPMHLVAIKLAAVASPYRRQGNMDWSDILNLIREQKLSLDDPEFQKIILRYGSEEILKKIKNDLS